MGVKKMWICGAVGLLVLFLPFTVSAEPTVTVQLPQDFPVGLPTIFAGDFEGERLPRQVFALYHPKLGGQKLLGQSDEEGRRVWIALTATSGVIGKTIELKGAEVETEPILKTVMVENYPDFETKEFRGAYVFLDGLRPVLLYQAKPVTRHEHTRAGFVHPLRGLDG